MPDHKFTDIVELYLITLLIMSDIFLKCPRLQRRQSAQFKSAKLQV